jgi:hypothetical protein
MGRTIFVSKSIALNTICCGTLSYNHMVDSGHCGIYIDINVDHLLGRCPPCLASPALKGIDSKNPKQCSKYLTTLLTYFNNHHIFYQSTQLDTKRTTKHGLTERLITK